MDYSALREKIDSMQEEILEGIRSCVKIESVGGKPEEGAPYGRGAKEALDFALDLGKKLGFRAVNVDNRAGYIERRWWPYWDTWMWCLQAKAGAIRLLRRKSVMDSFMEEALWMIRVPRLELFMR